MVARLGVDNLTQVLMQSLMNQGGLTKDMIGKRLMTFGAIGICFPRCYVRGYKVDF